VAVINIRGTNGSGKTTLVRSLIQSDPQSQLVRVKNGYTRDRNLPGTPAHYVPTYDCMVIGPYKPGIASGGMDCINSTAEALAAIDAATALTKNVVFEGILISTVYGTWLDFSQKLKRVYDKGMIWAFLMPPIETCLTQVGKRRAAAGRPEEGFNPNLVINKYKTVQRIMDKAYADGEHVVDLEPTRALDNLKGLLTHGH
jgi:hypothetical protein